MRIVAEIRFLEFDAVEYAGRTTQMARSVPVPLFLAKLGGQVKCVQHLYKAQQSLVFGYLIPVEPANLVILAVGVVIALLAAAHLVAHEQHRGTLAEH